jgi:hypothetical protein
MGLSARAPYQPRPASTRRGATSRKPGGSFSPIAEKCAVDQVDINSAVLGRLDRVRDLHQLARGGIWISQAARFGELHAASMSATWTCSPDRPNVYVAMSRSASSLVWHQDRGGWVRVCMRYDSAKSRAGGSRLELGQGVVVDTPYCVVGASVSWARYSLWVA